MSEAKQLNRMFRLSELPQFVGMGRTRINELIKVGQFPKPIPIGNSSRAFAWLEQDIIAWQLSRIAIRNGNATQ